MAMGPDSMSWPDSTGVTPHVGSIPGASWTLHMGPCHLACRAPQVFGNLVVGERERCLMRPWGQEFEHHCSRPSREGGVMM